MAGTPVIITCAPPGGIHTPTMLFHLGAGYGGLAEFCGRCSVGDPSSSRDAMITAMPKGTGPFR